MRIIDLISKDSVKLNLVSKDKLNVIDELVELVDNSGNLNINKNNENNMRKDVEYNKKPDDIIAEIITAKNRNGQTKTNKLNWIGEYQRFTSADVIKQ